MRPIDDCDASLYSDLPQRRRKRPIGGFAVYNSDLEVARVLTAYPSPDELLRAIRVRKADVVMLCIDVLAPSEAIINGLDNAVPGLPVITLTA